MFSPNRECAASSTRFNAGQASTVFAQLRLHSPIPQDRMFRQCGQYRICVKSAAGPAQFGLSLQTQQDPAEDVVRGGRDDRELSGAARQLIGENLVQPVIVDTDDNQPVRTVPAAAMDFLMRHQCHVTRSHIHVAFSSGTPPVFAKRLSATMSNDDVSIERDPVGKFTLWDDVVLEAKSVPPGRIAANQRGNGRRYYNSYIGRELYRFSHCFLKAWSSIISCRY
jgi:hypothetical protein